MNIRRTCHLIVIAWAAIGRAGGAGAPTEIRFRTPWPRVLPCHDFARLQVAGLDADSDVEWRSAPTAYKWHVPRQTAIRVSLDSKVVEVSPHELILRPTGSGWERGRVALQLNCATETQGAISWSCNGPAAECAIEATYAARRVGAEGTTFFGQKGWVYCSDDRCRPGERMAGGSAFDGPRMKAIGLDLLSDGLALLDEACASGACSKLIDTQRRLAQSMRNRTWHLQDATDRKSTVGRQPRATRRAIARFDIGEGLSATIDCEQHIDDLLGSCAVDVGAPPVQTKFRFQESYFSAHDGAIESFDIQEGSVNRSLKNPQITISGTAVAIDH